MPRRRAAYKHSEDTADDERLLRRMADWGSQALVTIGLGALGVLRLRRVLRARETNGPSPLENVDFDRVWTVLFAAAIPALAGVAFAAWWNHARFHTWNPAAMGHEHLTVGWASRIKKWGLMSYHFLPRNLSVVLASLPWPAPPGQKLPGGAPFLISGHGLALWFTTPLYLWLVRPARLTYVWVGCAAAAAFPVIADLLYQNSGWFTFGYRFSNDYAVLLFVMLAVSVRRFGTAFWACAIWAVCWNLFGAISFSQSGDRPAWSHFYSHDPSAYFPPD
jgi:hypothetical protein